MDNIDSQRLNNGDASAAVCQQYRTVCGIKLRYNPARIYFQATQWNNIFRKFDCCWHDNLLESISMT